MAVGEVLGHANDTETFLARGALDPVLGLIPADRLNGDLARLFTESHSSLADLQQVKLVVEILLIGFREHETTAACTLGCRPINGINGASGKGTCVGALFALGEKSVAARKVDGEGKELHGFLGVLEVRRLVCCRQFNLHLTRGDRPYLCILHA